MKCSPSNVRVTIHDAPCNPTADLAAYRWLLRRLFANKEEAARSDDTDESGTHSSSNIIDAIVAQNQGARNG